MKFQTGLTLLAGCASVALMAGCGSKAGNQAQQAIDNVSAQADHTAKLAAMQGTFSNGCQKSDAVTSLLFGLPSQSEVVAYGNSLQKTTTLYSDAACATPALRVTENADYNLGQKVSDQVYILDETMNSVSVMPFNDTEAAKLNAIPVPGVTLFSFCGINNWAANVPQDVTAKTQGTPAISHCWTQTPRKIADIIQITGSQLRFGDMSGGKDKTIEQNRPTAIDQSITYTKQ